MVPIIKSVAYHKIDLDNIEKKFEKKSDSWNWAESLC